MKPSPHYNSYLQSQTVKISLLFCLPQFRLFKVGCLFISPEGARYISQHRVTLSALLGSVQGVHVIMAPSVTRRQSLAWQQLLSVCHNSSLCLHNSSVSIIPLSPDPVSHQGAIKMRRG